MIDLNRILKMTDLSKKEIAEQLFPDHTHPTLALNRVIKKKSNLDSDQISKLSAITGISIADIFSGKIWSMGSNTNDTMYFENGDYRAELNMSNWTTKIFHKGSVFHEIVLHTRSIPLSEYLSSLNEVILKKEFGS